MKEGDSGMWRRYRRMFWRIALVVVMGLSILFLFESDCAVYDAGRRGAISGIVVDKYHDGIYSVGVRRSDGSTRGYLYAGGFWNMVDIGDSMAKPAGTLHATIFRHDRRIEREFLDYDRECECGE